MVRQGEGSSSSKAAPQQAVDFIRASMRVDLGSMSSAPCDRGLKSRCSLAQPYLTGTVHQHDDLHA